MAVEIKVPTVGESINEVTLTKWLKQDGDWVERDEPIAELESEKATFEINAEKAGILHTKAKVDDTLEIGQIAAEIDDTAQKPAEKAEKKQEPVAETSAAPKAKEEKPQPRKSGDIIAEPVVIKPGTSQPQEKPVNGNNEKPIPKATPLAAAIIADKNVNISGAVGTGAHGKLTRNDVIQIMEHPGRATEVDLFTRNEEKKKMSSLRRTISRRLVEAKNGTAMLTTFNEVDMKPIMDIRAKYKEVFKKTHNIGLGFMSFFTKACCFALQEWPAVNARLDGDSLVYHDYVDVSIAVSSPKGLVVPVIRNAESLSMAEIERAVADLAVKARENKLTIEEMTGGTFTITNGGVFGSLMSTPILNIPQSAILGMHNIVQRPVVIEGKIEIRPMMYVALSYDHRVIDGRESVSFLVRVKQMLESPDQLLFGKDPVKTLLEL
ncbi:MAG: 2-oxoglutarate dehydrogenase complex dihydrolipoyllysine-residue succinyltransferase [Chitinophagaceae bacterium]|nr:2-oxoglutarate dehydrogenase complex dihydrolipoyllysine-residue succinyltransferase [Chitinophagaceae bacterium]